MESQIHFRHVRYPRGYVGRLCRGHGWNGRLPLLFILPALLVTALPGMSSAEDAVEAVTRIYTTTVQTADHPERLADRLARSIDMDALAARILGAAYQDALPAERAAFDDAFLNVIAIDLSERLHGDQQLVIFGSRSLDNGDIVVFSRIIENDSSQSLIDWRMRPCADTYCIYDMRSDNVSFSVARRDDYAARLQSAGGSLAELTRALQSEVMARQ